MVELERPDASEPFHRRLGFWSALGVVVFDALYVGTGVVWLASGGGQSAEPLQPAEPFLTILEILLFASVPLTLTLAVALHAGAPPEHRTSAAASVAFMLAFAVLTTSIHYARLVVLRGLPSDAEAERAVLRLYPWPSIALGLDLLAWDFLLGLALLFAAPAVRGGRFAAPARNGLRICGALCVIGFLGPVSGDMRIQYLAIAGYAFGLPTVCALLAVRYAANPKEEKGSGP